MKLSYFYSYYYLLWTCLPENKLYRFTVHEIGSKGRFLLTFNFSKEAKLFVCLFVFVTIQEGDRPTIVPMQKDNIFGQKCPFQILFLQNGVVTCVVKFVFVFAHDSQFGLQKENISAVLRQKSLSNFFANKLFCYSLATHQSKASSKPQNPQLSQYPICSSISVKQEGCKNNSVNKFEHQREMT